MFIAEHHIAIRAVDHLTELIKVICNDSKLASKMKCHRTKATVLIQVIASDIQSLLRVSLNLYSGLAYKTLIVDILHILQSMPGYLCPAAHKTGI